MPWSRILPIGDSAGGQSPVSFGGFGAMIRHLKRLTFGIDEALKVDSLDKNALALLQPYQPNIINYQPVPSPNQGPSVSLYDQFDNFIKQTFPSQWFSTISNTNVVIAVSIILIVILLLK
jgi:hypothetical protein